jgi:hypothetical protein
MRSIDNLSQLGFRYHSKQISLVACRRSWVVVSQIVAYDGKQADNHPGVVSNPWMPSSLLPVCTGSIQVPCAPCFLGAESTTVTPPFSVQSVTVEVTPYIISQHNGSATTSYSTNTLHEGSLTTSLTNQVYTRSEDLTWVYSDATL